MIFQNGPSLKQQAVDSFPVEFFATGQQLELKNWNKDSNRQSTAMIN